MGANRIIDFVIGAIATTIAAYVVLYVFGTLLSSPVALNPGDPFYPIQQSLVQTVAWALLLLVPGAAGTAVVVVLMLRD